MTVHEYIGTSEAAKILNVSNSTVRRLADDNKFQCFTNPNNNYRQFIKHEIVDFNKKFSRPEPEQINLFETLEPDKNILYNIKAKSHPAHYLIHKYWGRKPYNVISTYITHFTEPGDTVLDPFMGSSMVPIESIKNGRFGIGVDINPISKFIGKNTVSKVDIEEFNKSAFNIINNLKEKYGHFYETACPDCATSSIITNGIWEENRLVRIKGNCSTHGSFVKNAENLDINKYEEIKELKKIMSLKKRIHYPQDNIFKYVQRSGVKNLDDLFNDRALILISTMKELIDDTKDDHIRSLLNIAFTSMLPNVSKMLPGDKEKGIYKSGWVISKFWVPKVHTERNVFNSFELRIRAISKAKRELEFVNNDLLTLKTHDSSNLDFLEDESIDYIFTDPPYGESIAYLALSQLWNSWLQNDVNYDDEIIIDSYRKKDYTDYSVRMKKVFSELYRVLKNNSFLSFTFNNRDLNVWKAVMDAVKESGFKLDFIIYQGQAVTSGTQGINKKNTLTGDFIYTLYKDKKYCPKNPVNSIDSEKFIKENIKRIIEKNKTITPTRLYELLIPLIVENDAYHDSNGTAIKIDKILKDNYDYVEVKNSNNKLGDRYHWQQREEI